MWHHVNKLCDEEYHYWTISSCRIKFCNIWSKNLWSENLVQMELVFLYSVNQFLITKSPKVLFEEFYNQYLKYLILKTESAIRIREIWFIFNRLVFKGLSEIISNYRNCRKKYYCQASNRSCTFVANNNCWSLRCSWSIACRRCSNYIFILDLTSGFNGWGKNNYMMRQETSKFGDLVHILLEILQSVLRLQGAVSIRKTVLLGMAIPMLKIRRPNGRLIFNMEIAIRR